MQKVSNSEFERELANVEREKKFNEIKITQNKNQLIRELKGGLGKQMMENPSAVEFIEKPKPTLKDKIINFFKRF